MSNQQDFERPTDETLSEIQRGPVLPRPERPSKPTPALHTSFTHRAAPSVGNLVVTNLNGNMSLNAIDDRQDAPDPFGTFVGSCFFCRVPWRFKQVGDIFRIRNRSTGRYLGNQGGVGFTTDSFDPSTDMWFVERATRPINAAAVFHHVGTGSVLDAIEAGAFEVTTGPATQRNGKWRIRATVTGAFRFQHEQTGEFLGVAPNFKAEMQPSNLSHDQQWEMEYLGSACTMQAWFIDRLLDARVTPDFGVVTRAEQTNSSQYWAIIERRPGEHTIQQIETGRYLTADPNQLTLGAVRVFVTDEASMEWSRWKVSSDAPGFELPGESVEVEIPNPEQTSGGLVLPSPEPATTERPVLHTSFTRRATPESAERRLRNLSRGGFQVLAAFVADSNTTHPFASHIAVAAVRWNFQAVGAIVRIRNRKTGRYLENHGGVGFTTDTSDEEHGMWLVERPLQPSTAPAVLHHVGSGMVLDAIGAGPFAVTTGPAPQRDGKWQVDATAGGAFTFQHDTTGEFLSVAANFGATMAPNGTSSEQHWDIEYLGSGYTMTFIDGRLLDAHVESDFAAVTRSQQNNSTQYWAVIERRLDEHTVQQVSTGRYLSVDRTQFGVGHPLVFTTENASEESSRWSFTSAFH